MSIIDNIKESDLDEDQRQLAELIGLDNYQKLIKTYGGTPIYIPKADAFIRASRNEQIKADFNGYNFRQLAFKYNLTEVQIRSIVADDVKRIRAKPIDGQMDLFSSAG